MVNYEQFELDNGLRLLVHIDKNSPMAAVNTLYRVGARDEKEGHTGFAHLFEHLMFGGSANIPDFDAELQKAGGENNAFTNNDITNYYDVLPANNIDTALWLESDRMNLLDFSQRSLDVQIKVVCEEFRENYINQPYGDLGHIMRKLAYKVHPYKWPTIGETVEEIEAFTLDEVEAFFYRYYRPNNATLVVASALDPQVVLEKVKYWYGDIDPGETIDRGIPTEPAQTESRRTSVDADVPVDVILKCYHMCDRLDDRFYATDLISDIMSNGGSSRFNQKLVKEAKLFTELDGYISGALDAGLFIVDGRLSDGVSMEQAEKAIDDEIALMVNEKVSKDELQKVKNKAESYLLWSGTGLLQRAMQLAQFDMLGSADLVNHELTKYLNVTADQIHEEAQNMFTEENSSTIFYNARKN